MRSQVISIDYYRTEIPLTAPYKLSFGPVNHFDTFLARIELADGRVGWGEATVLTGYTDETTECAWETGQLLAERLVGLSTQGAREIANGNLAKTPFTATAFLTALEMAEGHRLLENTEPLSLPLLAITSGRTVETLAPEVGALIAEGYGTVKFKVGFELESDLTALAALQEVVEGRVRIRVDANQGYSAAEAIAFLKRMSPQDIELVEQPCASDDWDAAEEVAKYANVPLMLDESIYDEGDIRRAARLGCAGFIKLKLMKFGSLDRLAAALDLISELGMTPVLGNGVASDLGCWMEACVGARHVATAGEMNGFLKPAHPLFDVPLRVEGGRLVVVPGQCAQPRLAELDRVTMDRCGFGKTTVV